MTFILHKFTSSIETVNPRNHDMVIMNCNKIIFSSVLKHEFTNSLFYISSTLELVISLIRMKTFAVFIFIYFSLCSIITALCFMNFSEQEVSYSVKVRVQFVYNVIYRFTSTSS